jgi:hypothetical protein
LTPFAYEMPCNPILYEGQREKVQGEQSNEQGGIPSRIPKEEN